MQCGLLTVLLNCDLCAYTITLCSQTEYQKKVTGLIVFKLTNDPILQTPGFEIILVKHFGAHFETRTVRNSVVLSFRCFICNFTGALMNFNLINIRDFEVNLIYNWHRFQFVSFGKSKTAMQILNFTSRTQSLQ